MSVINVPSVIMGGLVAGLVANGFDFVITTYLMATEFARIMARLNIGSEPSLAWIEAGLAGGEVDGRSILRPAPSCVPFPSAPPLRRGLRPAP